jgi:hypothetical protein
VARGTGTILALVAGLAVGCAVSPVRPSRDVAAEVRRLEAEVAAVGAAPERRPDLHLALARLHLDPANPSPDYRAALAELRFFASLDPRGASAPDVQQWLRALEHLERVTEDRDRLAARAEKLAKANAEAQGTVEALRRAAESQAREAAGLRDAVKALSRDNEELRGQIEKLRELDRQLELLRRNVR